MWHTHVHFDQLAQGNIPHTIGIPPYLHSKDRGLWDTLRNPVPNIERSLSTRTTELLDWGRVKGDWCYLLVSL